MSGERPFLTTNAADRLREILIKARQSPANTPLLQVWARALKIPSNETLRVLARLSDLHALTVDVETKIQEIPNLNHQNYLLWLPAVRQLIVTENLSPSKNLAPLDGAINSLRECAELLQQNAPERGLTHHQLQELSNELTALINSVKENSALSKKLKELLLDLLQAARVALETYQVRGAKGLREDWFTILAKVELHAHEIEEAKDDSTVEKVMKWIGKFNQVSAVLVGIHTTYEKLAPLLPHIAQFLALPSQ